jgi:hypothetical protein
VDRVSSILVIVSAVRPRANAQLVKWSASKSIETCPFYITAVCSELDTLAGFFNE